MKHLRQIQMAIFSAMLMFFLFTSAAIAAPPVKPMGPAKAIVKPPIVQTDLVVREIFSSQCPCDQEIAHADAMLYKGIRVIVGNYPCSVGVVADSVDAVVKVEFYDLKLGRMITWTRNITLRGNVTQTVNFTNAYVLMKRSRSIKATIAVKAGSRVRDCNMSNNANEVSQCMLRPVY